MRTGAQAFDAASSRREGLLIALKYLRDEAERLGFPAVAQYLRRALSNIR